MLYRTFSLIAAMVLLSTAAFSQVPAQVMKYLSRYTSNPPAYNAGAAEVVAYDPATKRVAYIDANSNKVTIIDISDVNNPTFVRDIFLLAYNGAANSIAIHNGIVAIALENLTSKQLPGNVLFVDINGAFQAIYEVGALPDMITFTPDGTRVIVCNEGEPNADYSVDPEGSVSIINISSGITTATVQTVGFTSLNGKQDSLRAMGIRIYGPNASVAQDLEPEYAAISADSRTAYVAIQEANALAVIDIPTATLTRVVALGYKDYSKGLPRAMKYPWTDRPVIGQTPAGQDVKLGGCSGLWYVGTAPGDTTKWRFLTHPDRGPNAEPSTVRGATRRPFVLPNYQAEVNLIELNRVTGQITLVERTPLHRFVGQDSLAISGLPNLQAAGQGFAYTDELPVNLLGEDLNNDPFGADLEGIVVDAQGNWWMVDEYRPAIYHFQPNGRLINRYVPAGTAASVGAAAGTFGVEAIPAVYARRRANRGFEAVAIEGNIIYAFIQSSIDNPDAANDVNSRNSTWCRILAFDTQTMAVVGEYLYPMFEKFGGADKIGDAVSLGNGRFMVIERDDATGLRARKYLFEIDLRGATNLTTATINLPLGRTIESLSFAEMAQYGIKPVWKQKAVYLPGVGYGDYDKPEGLALINSNTFAIINDNDFGVGASPLPNPPTGRIAIDESKIPVLGIITFDRPNGLDPSDRDSGVGNLGAYRMGNWPVYGMYQPDAIDLITIDGQTYIVSANEGDAREYSTYAEEVRVNDAAVVLDATSFAGWPNLKLNTTMGRLTIVNNIGDVDGDGDYDRMYTLGARSFSIWNADGNLIWDSGNEFERLTYQFYPRNFNTGHTTNAIDDRSDNKGPEPEAVSIGVINDSTYAFIGNERIGGIFMYNVSDPTNPTYTDYVNSRDFAVTPNLTNVTNGTVGDLGTEVIKFIPSSLSPNGSHVVISGNEISGTVSLYSVRIPQIISRPADTVRVCRNERLELTVEATGMNLTYQWMRNGQPIPDADSSTYVVDSATSADEGIYSCSVRSDGGMHVTPSQTTVIVAFRTELLQEPPALIQTAPISSVFIEVRASQEAGERYQWYRAGVALQESIKFRGVNTNRLQIFNMQFADTSSAYYCIVTGGCSSVRTRNVAVLIPRVLIETQPTARIEACPGDTIVIRTAARQSGGDIGLGYQWRKFPGVNVVDDERITGANSPVLTIAGATLADAGQYFCNITGVPSTEVGTTSTCVVDVADRPELLDDLANVNGDTVVFVCDNGSANLRVTAVGASRYEWLRNGEVVIASGNPSETIRGGGQWQVRMYSRCGNTVTASRVLNVESRIRPRIGLQPQATITRRVGDRLEIEFTLSSGTPEISYQWFKDDRPVPGATSATYVVAEAAFTDAGRYYCVARNSCGVQATRIVRVNILQAVSVDESELPVEPTVVCSPNPMRSEATLQYAVPVSGMAKVTLVGLDGTVLAVLANADVAAGWHRATIDASMLPAAGLYMIRLETSAGTATLPVVHVR